MQHIQEHIDDEMIKIEVNLDDITGELLGHVMDLLFNAGANDVYYVPIYMKKNRPGTMLQVLCQENDKFEMMDIIFKETTTLGVRFYPMSVKRLGRRFKKVKTPWGTVSIKEGLLRGEIVQQAPEYSECKALSDKHGVPLKLIYQEVWKQLKG
ncbi:LarC family nickel insertion protein [Peribacillus simplex]|uniref:nickel insertion protein n=1 Tax=Peribacillus simplex TaxID=1478 RepID=UPI0010BE9ED7|nr:nickel insertion protein [Peribacillus simplex]TKH03454.1 LarC family nickel insertion protein [Peribacillus simplex]